MLGAYQQHVESQLREIRGAGLWKPERILDSPQRPVARLHGGRDVVVLCANNYLGLADDPRVTAHLTGPVLGRLFEPMSYQGAAQTFIDRLVGTLKTSNKRP